MKGILLGCGNPLLDMLIRVEDGSVLQKWGLKTDDAILATDKHIEMFDQLYRDHDVSYIPGGSTLNTFRVFQWVLGVDHAAVYFGAIGNDKFGKILKEKSLESGVDVRFQINSTIKSGTCAAIIYHKHRSLCAHLAAADTFTLDHIHKPENQKLIENAQFYYASGFFLTVCPDAVLELAKRSAVDHKKMAMNLGAPFVLQFYFEAFNKVLPYVDVLFGNRSEYLALAEALKMETKDLKDIARAVAQMTTAKNQKGLVIVTQESDPTIVTTVDGAELYPTIPLSVDEIVDTNAAGDAFVGGFLAQYIQKKPVKACVECAHYAACEILKEDGCTIPGPCQYR